MNTYWCSASSLALDMSKTLTTPELKPQEKIGSLGWKATQPGLSTDTKSYTYSQETTECNAIVDEEFRRQLIEDAIMHTMFTDLLQ